MSKTPGARKRAPIWKPRLGPSLLGTLTLVATVAQASSAMAACGAGGKTLGVSRVIELDTRQGTLYGQQQYKDSVLLEPGEVLLTFDDGPLRVHTQPILNALEAQCTKATFFMVGAQAVADPDMVKRVLAKGHTVGNHTWSHANLRKATPLKARQEIELGLSATTAAAGQPIAPFYRFPYLADTKAMLGYSQTRGFGVFSIDVDSQDWKTKSAAAVHRDVLSQLAELGKGVILFHDIQPATAQALPGLLEALRVKGYRVVHVKPKTMASTLPEFDSLARNEKTRLQATTAANPLSDKAMTWGAAAPGVAGGPKSMPTRQAAAPAGGPAGSANPPAPDRAQARQQPTNAPPSALPPIPPNAQNLPPPQRVARPAVSPDWRDKVFGR